MVTTPSMIEWQGFPNPEKSFFFLEALKVKFLSSVYPYIRARCSPKCCKDIFSVEDFQAKFIYSVYTFLRTKCSAHLFRNLIVLSMWRQIVKLLVTYVFRFLANITLILHCSIGAKMKFNGLLRHICYTTFSY